LTASQAVKKREDNVIPATIIMKPRASPISPNNKRGKQIIIINNITKKLMIPVPILATIFSPQVFANNSGLSFILSNTPFFF